jgi:hypothetical protein
VVDPRVGGDRSGFVHGQPGCEPVEGPAVLALDLATVLADDLSRLAT